MQGDLSYCEIYIARREDESESEYRERWRSTYKYMHDNYCPKCQVLSCCCNTNKIAKNDSFDR